MSGREYKIRRWVEAEGRSWAMREEEYPFSVRDGAWVLEVSSGYSTQTYYHDEGEDFRSETQSEASKFEVVGQAQQITLSSHYRSQTDSSNSYRLGGRDVLLVSSEPFGVISWHEEDGELDGGKYFRPARQIHKGELGRGPEAPMPLFAREAPSTVTEWTSPRDRKRGYIGWARLTEVAAVAKLEPHQVILDYWDFVDARGSTKLDVVIAFSRDQIHKKAVSPDIRVRFTRQQVEELVAAGNTQWHDFWIRRGFARTVLMLRYFGYTPQPELQPA